MAQFYVLLIVTRKAPLTVSLWNCLSPISIFWLNKAICLNSSYLYCIVWQSETFVYSLIKTQTFELKVVIKMRKINWNSIWTIFIINDPGSWRRLRVSHFPAPTKIRKESSKKKKNNVLRYESSLLIAVKKSWKTGQLMLIGN